MNENWFQTCRAHIQLGTSTPQELSARSAVDGKELFESCEFWHRTRRRVRRPVVVDMACGCGLTGILFAVAEPSVKRVLLVDRIETESLRRVLEAAEAAAPWALDKISFVQSDISPGTLARVLLRSSSSSSTADDKEEKEEDDDDEKKEEDDAEEDVVDEGKGYDEGDDEGDDEKGDDEKGDDAKECVGRNIHRLPHPTQVKAAFHSTLCFKGFGPLTTTFT